MVSVEDHFSCLYDCLSSSCECKMEENVSDFHLGVTICLLVS